METLNIEISLTQVKCYSFLWLANLTAGNEIVTEINLSFRGSYSRAAGFPGKCSRNYDIKPPSTTKLSLVPRT